MLLSLTYLFWGSHLPSYNFSLGFSIYVTDGPNLNCHHGGWVHWRVEPSSHSGRGNLRRGNRPFNVCSMDQEKPSFNDASKVKLLVNKENGEACAMKEVCDSNHVTVDICFKVLSHLVHAHYCSIAQFSWQVDLSVHPDAEECVKKEICVHKLLKHRNVVGCYGSRSVSWDFNHLIAWSQMWRKAAVHISGVSEVREE